MPYYAIIENTAIVGVSQEPLDGYKSIEISNALGQDLIANPRLLMEYTVFDDATPLHQGIMLITEQNKQTDIDGYSLYALTPTVNGDCTIYYDKRRSIYVLDPVTHATFPSLILYATDDTQMFCLGVITYHSNTPQLVIDFDQCTILATQPISTFTLKHI